MLNQIRQVFRDSTPAQIAGDCIGALSLFIMAGCGLFLGSLF